MSQIDLRPQRALQIAQEGHVKLVGENSFRVDSQTGKGSYLVTKVGENWSCQCPDYTVRSIPCKHIYSCILLPSLKVQVRQPEPIAVVSETPSECVFCQSKTVVKRGFIHEKAKKVQRFFCKSCRKTFVPDLGFKKMKNDSKAITAALDAYFRGLSLRDVRDHLAQFCGVKVHETTVLRWIEKYSKVISGYVNTLAPTLSENWHADELYVKMRGGVKETQYNQPNMAFLWNVMDRRTRFLLASKLSSHRDVGAAARAFQEAAKNAHDSEPERIFTDGLHAYSEGITFAPFSKDPEHVARSGIKKPHANNNRIERLNGTVRERVKVQRGWKSMGSAVPEGHRIFYNFVRPHMALEEQTPAQAAGIDLGLNGNKWMELIQKAQSTQHGKVPSADAQETH